MIWSWVAIGLLIVLAVGALVAIYQDGRELRAMRLEHARDRAELDAYRQASERVRAATERRGSISSQVDALEAAKLKRARRAARGW